MSANSELCPEFVPEVCFAKCPVILPLIEDWQYSRESQDSALRQLTDVEDTITAASETSNEAFACLTGSIDIGTLSLEQKIEILRSIDADVYAAFAEKITELETKIQQVTELCTDGEPVMARVPNKFGPVLVTLCGAFADNAHFESDTETNVKIRREKPKQ
ncbi:hypothetical protein KDA00_02930 [Candidatus Saccharibacteria bacterium]|nr:hypothetical protein [Candidatus Saccharibacteria bacterium]